MARLAVVVCIVASVGRLSAQECVGDCSGRGAVGINDLILAVNIALGSASPDECPALGPPPIGIAQLIASVSNALCACQPCPTAPPTPTPTETALPSATATPSATPTYAVSKWREDQFRIPATDCPARIAKRVRDALQGASETYTVRDRGARSQIEDSNGNLLSADIDAAGVLHAGYATTQQYEGCTQVYTQTWQVDLTASPSTATYSGAFTTKDPCRSPVNCSQTITSRWTLRSGSAP